MDMRDEILFMLKKIKNLDYLDYDRRSWKLKN